MSKLWFGWRKQPVKINMNQNLTQNNKILIRNYYSERIALIKKVVEEVNGIMEEYRERQVRSLKDLEGILVKKSLRHTDFGDMIQELVEMQGSREEEVREILRKFLEETEQISSRLENLLKEPDVKKFKKFIAQVRTQQRKKKIEIGKMIEQRLDDTKCNMQALLEEFKNERIALNLEWEQLKEQKERLAPINLLTDPIPTA